MKKFLLIAFCLTTLKLEAQTYRLDIKNRDDADSAGIMNLYFQSGNLRQITVIDPFTGDPVKGIALQTHQGEIGKSEKMYFLSPNDPSGMKLFVIKGREMLADTTFKTLPTPVPSCSFYSQGKNQVLDHGFRISTHDTISVKFVVDSLYALKCPADVNYKISEITVVKNGNIRNTIKVNGSFQLNKLGLISGETIKLELNKFKRTNYSGREIEINASPEDFVILKIE
jgi:hypothetical protein